MVSSRVYTLEGLLDLYGSDPRPLGARVWLQPGMALPWGAPQKTFVGTLYSMR